MPDTPRDPATDPRVGDRLIHQNGALTLTVTGIGNLITWSVERGLEKPLHFNASPAEFACRMACSIEAGAIFVPAPSSSDPSFPSLPSVKSSSPQP